MEDKCDKTKKGNVFTKSLSCNLLKGHTSSHFDERLRVRWTEQRGIALKKGVKILIILGIIAGTIYVLLYLFIYLFITWLLMGGESL